MPRNDPYLWTQRKPRAGWQADPTAVAELGLAGAWLFNEWNVGGNPILDVSGNQNTATINGGATWGNGRFGPDLNFNGSSQYVNVPSSTSLNFSTSWSYSTWVYWLGTGTNNAIIFYRETGPSAPQGTYAGVIRAFSDGGHAPGTFTLSMNCGGGWGDLVISNNAVPQSVWTHLAGTWDGATAKLYFNGALDNSASVSGSLGPVSAALSIARESSQANEYYKGAIDHLLLSNRALSPGEIATLYARPFWWMRPPRRKTWFGGIAGITVGAGAVQGTASVVASSLATGAGTVQGSATTVASSLATSSANLQGSATVVASSLASGSAGVQAAATYVASSLEAGAGTVHGSAAILASSLSSGSAGVSAAASSVASSLAAGESGIQAAAALMASSVFAGSGGVSASAVCVVSGAVGEGQVAVAAAVVASSVFVGVGGISASVICTVGGVVSAVISTSVQFAYIQNAAIQWSGKQSQSPKFVYVQTEDVEFSRR